MLQIIPLELAPHVTVAKLYSVKHQTNSYMARFSC